VEIQIEEPGFWKFILEKETKKAVSDEFHLEVDGDNAPVVTLESNPPETLANNQSLNIQWSAKDDYGLKKILVEYEVNGEKRSNSFL
jgi:hypothetical protein